MIAVKAKQRRWWQVALAVALMVAMGAGGALGAKIKEFTADNVILNADGSVKSRGKVYMASDKMRAEHDMDEMGKLVLIYRRDKNELWALNPKKKIYVAMPMDAKKWEEEAKGMVKSENATILGKETVNGYACVKKRVTRNMEVMGMKMTSTQTIWVSDRIEMPIRTRTQEGQVTELRNIKEGRPPARVFEIPAGYKKVGNDMGALFMAGEGMEMPAMGGSQGGGQGAPGGMKLPFKLPKGMKMPFGGSGN